MARNPILEIGLSLSLSGRYAEMGRQAHAALQLFAAGQNDSGGLALDGRRHRIEIRCFDDCSDPVRCAEIYRWICFESRSDLIFGPYSSTLARIAAPIADGAGRVFINHGGADDALYERGYRMIVGVLSPASSYLTGLARLLGRLKFWRKRVAIVASVSPFAQAVAGGFSSACKSREGHRRGIRVRLECRSEGAGDPSVLRKLARHRLNALVSAGSFEHDAALMRAVIAASLNIPMLACVAAGISRFQRELGADAEGIVGASQWEEQVNIQPEIGPAPARFVRRLSEFEPGVSCDYPAAQIYAAGLLAAAALAKTGNLDQNRLREAFSDLNTSTLFGEFSLDRVSGRQIGHKMLLVQWHEGQKAIIDPEVHAEVGAIEFPPGWKLILASLRSLRITVKGSSHDEQTQDRR